MKPSLIQALCLLEWLFEMARSGLRVLAHIMSGSALPDEEAAIHHAPRTYHFTALCET